ncbi:MAG: hypothetical protein OXE92_03560 [Bacteroidetes bacterium]|nr:hypothetical protein [Bacteroidota bacterium]MCY4204785.1 hypothetical protein [Bacteroidota bacterium]
MELYKWYDSEQVQEMIALGEDSLYAECYFVHEGYLRKFVSPSGNPILLGNLIRFNAIDPDTFEGPFEKTKEEITAEYGPILTDQEIRRIMERISPGLGEFDL